MPILLIFREINESVEYDSNYVEKIDDYMEILKGLPKETYLKKGDGFVYVVVSNQEFRNCFK